MMVGQVEGESQTSCCLTTGIKYFSVVTTGVAESGMLA